MKCLANVFQGVKEKEEWILRINISHYFLHIMQIFAFNNCMSLCCCSFLLLFVIMWNHNWVCLPLHFAISLYCLFRIAFVFPSWGENCSFLKSPVMGVGGPDHVPFNWIINVNLFTHQCDSECQVKRKKINKQQKTTKTKK